MRPADLITQTSIIMLACTVTISPGRSQTQPTAPSVAWKPKNPQIFKGMKNETLLSTMRDFNKSLSVKCDFCHDSDSKAPGHIPYAGYEKDTNPMKRQARDMFRMMDGLNHSAKTVDGQVTCWMCHHGHPEPETRGPHSE